MFINEEVIQKDKLYIQLFRIFEKELLSIFETVAPFKRNLRTYGNKIHELHLRICSEVENLAKEVSKDLFEENEIKDLERKPFLFCFSLLNGKLGLSSKKLIFIGGIEEYNFRDENSYFTPFLIKKGKEVPIRRTHYNNIKHNKLKSYNICNLGDLVNAFGAYYILLNYLVVGFKRPLQTAGLIMYNPLQKTKKGDSLKSSVFIPTSVYVRYPSELYSKSVNLEIIDTGMGCINEIDELLTCYHNRKFEEYVNMEIKPVSCLYYTAFFILPCVKTDGLKVYKIFPFMKFMNKGKENIKTSILLNIDKNGSKEYMVDTGWPSDFTGIYQRIKNDNI